MGRVEFTRPWPPLQAPRLCLHSSQEGRAGREEVSSMLALLCALLGALLGALHPTLACSTGPSAPTRGLPAAPACGVCVCSH